MVFKVGDPVHSVPQHGSERRGTIREVGDANCYLVEWGGVPARWEPGENLRLRKATIFDARKTLDAHGWTLDAEIAGNYRYRRGEESIELLADGYAFYCFDGRRMTNGNWSRIVEIYAVRPVADTRHDVTAMIGRLDELLSPVDASLRDEAVAMLERYAEKLEG